MEKTERDPGRGSETMERGDGGWHQKTDGQERRDRGCE